MIGIAASRTFCFLFLYFSYKCRRDFSELVKYHLALLAQTPVVLFLNHNLDRGSYSFGDPNWPMMLPVLLSLIILSAAAVRFFMSATGKIRIFLSPIMIGYLAYTLLCILSAAQGSDPKWSFYAILWTLPFGCIFFFAGKQDYRLASNSTPLTYSVIFSCLLSIMIVIFALVTGRTHSIFNTRSYGSILSITGVLQMLIVYVPLASFEKRNSKVLEVLFWSLPVAVFGLSLSRSAVVPFFVCLLAMSKAYNFNIKTFIFRPATYIAGLFVGTVTVVVLFFTQMGEVWLVRFTQLPYAVQLRLEIFAPYWKSIKMGNPFYGVGYGLTRFHHPEGYTDLHNLLLTELFENGLGAAIVFFVILLMVSSYIFRCLMQKKFMLISITVLLTILLAHLQGINLAIRNPGAYTTPYFTCVLFLMFGLLERQVFEENDQH